MVDKSMMDRIRDANHSWPTRVQSELHDFQYDFYADILYLAYGDPSDAFSVPLEIPEEAIYLRVELDTFRIVGLDIMNFRHAFITRHSDAREAFDPFFNLLGKMDWRIQLRLPSDETEGQISLLLPARASLNYFPTYIPKVVPQPGSFSSPSLSSRAEFPERGDLVGQGIGPHRPRLPRSGSGPRNDNY